MSLYRWEHEDPQHQATEALPTEAIAALDALMDAVVFDPTDHARSPTEPVGKDVRHPAPPGGRGQASILIHEPDVLVLALRVTWPGKPASSSTSNSPGRSARAGHVHRRGPG